MYTYKRDEAGFSVYDEENHQVGEIHFDEGGGEVYTITHTGVRKAAEGQGIAGELVKRTAALAREEGKKIKPVCSYAVAWFKRHPEEADLLI